MRGPEGRPPNVEPSPEGLGIYSEDDLSAEGAALNLSRSHLCYEERTGISYYAELDNGHVSGFL